MEKKLFAKTVGQIRKEMGTAEYPKAMYTGQQAANRTCTVNCGRSEKMANEVLGDKRLVELIKGCSGRGVIEYVKSDNKYQVRISW